MKKILLIILVSMMVVVVAACGNKNNDENNILDANVDANYPQDDNNYLEDLIGKTSLTLKDLDRIDEYRFPKSYSYITYKWGASDSTVETGNYVYSKDVGNKLLPIYEDVADRELVNSSMEDDRIVTMVDITLNNGESYSLEYINDPETLEYVQVIFGAPMSMTIYTFNY